jgi:hypothetical protein
MREQHSASHSVLQIESESFLGDFKAKGFFLNKYV